METELTLKKNKPLKSPAQLAYERQAYEDMMEANRTCVKARQLLGLPTLKAAETPLPTVLPKFRLLAILIKGGIFGMRDAGVLHMAQRNVDVDAAAAMKDAVRA